MTTILTRRLSMAAVAAAVCIASGRAALVAGPQPPGATPVRTVAGGQPFAGSTGERGATYYALEGQTTRLTTAFVDGAKAFAERGIDGDLQTRLEDAQGNEINRFKVDRIDGVNDLLQYMPAGGVPVLAQPNPNLRHTLDWANQQSHRLFQDRVVDGTRLQWKGGLMRAAGAVARTGDDEREVRAVETQWANGLSARTERRAAKPGTTYRGKAVAGDVMSTTLRLNGVEIGDGAYFTMAQSQERLYVWHMPGLSEGEIGTQHLKPRHGGWLFTPDMVWMNLQTIGMYHWKTLIRDRGTVACQAPSRNPIVQFFMPTVSANEAGCDGLHYLDGGIYRVCCDNHDRCYETSGCSSSSWWYWGGWSCTYCNVAAVGCFFAATGADHVRYPYGG